MVYLCWFQSFEVGGTRLKRVPKNIIYFKVDDD